VKRKEVNRNAENEIVLASVGALLFLALAVSSFAATVKVTDSGLEPGTDHQAG
jgi:hypothetical protein